MTHYTENLKKLYPEIGGTFDYTLECFVYDMLADDPKHYLRPAMLVFPGGGYWMVSDREAAPIAISFLAKGFNCYVLRYSTGDVAPDSHFPDQLVQAAAAMDYIKNKAAEHRTDTNNISVIGFSAGGHMAGMISCLFDHESIKAAFPNKPENYFRPHASVLSYAVLSSDPEIAHLGSFENLTGKDAKTTKSLSLEKCVTAKTPPAFIWHTSDDTCVNVCNSLVYAEALRKNGVPFEMHIYPRGPHGISLANRLTSNGNAVIENASVAEWADEAADFILNGFPE